jgi:hypothetical protein
MVEDDARADAPNEARSVCAGRGVERGLVLDDEHATRSLADPQHWAERAPRRMGSRMVDP